MLSRWKKPATVSIRVYSSLASCSGTYSGRIAYHDITLRHVFSLPTCFHGSICLFGLPSAGKAAGGIVVPASGTIPSVHKLCRVENGHVVGKSNTSVIWKQANVKNKMLSRGDEEPIELREVDGLYTFQAKKTMT